MPLIFEEENAAIFEARNEQVHRAYLFWTPSYQDLAQWAGGV